MGHLELGVAAGNCSAATGVAADVAATAPNVREDDLRMFAVLGIPPELLAEARVGRVNDAEAREKYGIRGGGDMSGLAFPYPSPGALIDGEFRRNYVRIRRDHPEIEDGRPKKKYVAPWGDRKHLYFPPAPELFADTSVPIVLIESEKGSLALLAWSRRVGRKILPIALGGCWGWRGRIVIKGTSTGERVEETGAIPDLNICRDGRVTYALLDSDRASNPMVQAAGTALVHQLRRQGANVRILDLPAGEGINGPDDFIARRGDDAMGRLLDGVIEGAKVLDHVVEFLRRFVFMSNAQAVVIALWAAHTYVFKTGIYTPYLAITSATKRCGKSRLQEALGFLVHKPWTTSGVTAASLFRQIEANQPTLFLDEVDALFQGDKETAQTIRAVLNSGNHYKGTCSRVVGKGADLTTKDFSTFCPKAIGGIGALPDTVADRSLHIRLVRKPPCVKVERLRERDIKPEADSLHQRLETWCTSILEQVRDARPLLPEELNDRQQDAVEILLAIADIAGDDWPVKARRAVVELCTGDEAQDEDHRTQLLADIKAVFQEEGVNALRCGALAEKLRAIETSLWNEWRGGKGLTASGLGMLLKPFGIKARQIWIGAEKKNVRHYVLEDFQPKFASYLPASTSSPLEALEPAKTLDETHRFYSARTQPLADCENNQILRENAASSAPSGLESRYGSGPDLPPSRDPLDGGFVEGEL